MRSSRDPRSGICRSRLSTRASPASVRRHVGAALRSRRACAASLASAMRSSRAATSSSPRLLRQAAMDDLTPERYRVQQLRARQCSRSVAALVAAVTSRCRSSCWSRPWPASCTGRAGRVPGSSDVASRAARIRLELYTVNQLLAMQVRTGSGAMQAVQRVVDRGRGAVVQELGDVLTWMRSGMGEAEAFRRAAELTPEPSAARHLSASRGRGRAGCRSRRRAAGVEQRHPRRASRADAQGRGPSARRDARADDRDPRSDHVALHRRAASLDCARTPLTLKETCAHSHNT